MSQGTIWSRMAAWVRPTARNGPGLHTINRTGEDDGTVALATRRPDPALTKLEEGYNKVIDLIDAIKRHQHGQAERATEVTEALTQMSATLERIDNSDRTQSDHLAALAEEAHAAGQRAVRWEEALCEFPRMADAQREALAAVSRQLQEGTRRDGELLDSLTSFREVVRTLSDATTASTVALKDLQRASLAQQEFTGALIRAQSKRFTVLLAVTVGLAAVGMIVAIASLLRAA